MQKFESVDARCKFFEKNYSFGPYLMAGVPSLCRVDGKAFHTFTKGLRPPFDERLSKLMVGTAKFLMEQTQATWSFVQSDEISLCWFKNDSDSQIFFDGKTQKIVSLTAAMATYHFNRELASLIPEKANTYGLFDSRAWSVPSLDEALIYAKWRQQDTVKNAVSMAAHTLYSNKELHGVNTRSKIGMLKKKGVEFAEFPWQFRKGTLLRRVTRDITFSADELEKLPENHQARKNPLLTFRRNVVEYKETPRLSQLANPIEFLFNGEEPSVLNKKEGETHV